MPPTFPPERWPTPAFRATSHCSAPTRLLPVRIRSTALAYLGMPRIISWEASAATAVALTSDVSGTLAVANGGSGAASASAARANLGAAASGANSDITSLAGLTTPVSATQGGSGQSSYTVGDLLYANASSSLTKL